MFQEGDTIHLVHCFSALKPAVGSVSLSPFPFLCLFSQLTSHGNNAQRSERTKERKKGVASL
jgi:hypothetical protein